jgi:hypothetical protein
MKATRKTCVLHSDLIGIVDQFMVTSYVPGFGATRSPHTEYLNNE